MRPAAAERAAVAACLVLLAGVASWNAAYFGPATVHGVERGWGPEGAGLAAAAALPTATYAVARRAGAGSVLGVLAGALVAVDLDVATWAARGLGTVPGTLLLAGFAWSLQRRWTDGETLPWSAVLGALLCVVRPEAIVLCGAAAAGEIARAWTLPGSRRAALAWLATLALPCAAFLGSGLVTFDGLAAATRPLPAGEGGRLDPFLAELASWLAVGSPVTGAALALVAPFSLGSRGALVAAAALAVQAGLVLRAGGDGMEQARAWVPAVPLAAALIAGGAERVLRGAWGRVAGALLALGFAAQGARHLQHERLDLADGKARAVERGRDGARAIADRGVGVSRGEPAGAAPAAGRGFAAQSANASFEEVDAAGLPAGWSPVPGDATAFAVVAVAAPTGARALRVDDALWVCTPWSPVLGDIRVAGQVRAQAVEGATNERQGAAVGLRIERSDGVQEYPTLRAWQGTTEWTPFALTWPADPAHARYRACVGRNGASGTAWFDDVRAGSADAP